LFSFVVFVCRAHVQLVGLAAKQHMMKHPTDSISGVKRFIGRTVTDSELESTGPFKVWQSAR